MWWKNLSLDDAINHDGLQPINLGSKNEYIKSDSLIFSYLSTHLKILLNQKNMNSIGLVKRLNMTLLGAIWE